MKDKVALLADTSPKLQHDMLRFLRRCDPNQTVEDLCQDLQISLNWFLKMIHTEEVSST